MKLRISGQTKELPKFQKSKDLKGWRVEKRPGGWTVLESPDGIRQRVVMVERQGKISAWIHTPQGSGSWHMEVIRDAHAGHGDAGHGGDLNLVSQFPGKIRKIQVQDGQKVKVGEVLILMEAMKMEFSIKAPVDGVVVRVLVAEGQQVSPGDRFFDFEGG